MKRNISAMDEEVKVLAGAHSLPGRLTVPSLARGIVVFAHGSGSSRNSPRNLAVAQVLNENGLATLLFDLLMKEEESDRDNVFNIELLAERLLAATSWLHTQPNLTQMPLGYFGASTGAAAALWAASDPTANVSAVVSRGGRADMAADKLMKVKTPTLLIVGGEDGVVIDLNRTAQAQLQCVNQMVIIPGATHLFEEPGALEQVADLACRWFLKYLSS